MKNLSELREQESFSRKDLLTVIDYIKARIGIEGYSRLLDIQEELGFDRYDDAED